MSLIPHSYADDSPEAEILRGQLDRGYVFIWDDIGPESAKHVITQMRYIYHVKRLATIYLFIHTDGGELDSCCAIIDEMVGLQSLGVNIITVALGKAYSSGALILIMGSERYATANSSIMLHPVSLHLPQDYLQHQTKVTEFTNHLYDRIMMMVAEKCGKKTKRTKDRFIESVKPGLWLSCKEAKKLGVIDGEWNYEWEKNETEDNL